MTASDKVHIEGLAMELQPIMQKIGGTREAQLVATMVAAAVAAGPLDRATFLAACETADAALAQWVAKSRASPVPRPN